MRTEPPDTTTPWVYSERFRVDCYSHTQEQWQSLAPRGTLRPRGAVGKGMTPRASVVIAALVLPAGCGDTPPPSGEAPEASPYLLDLEGHAETRITP